MLLDPFLAGAVLRPAGRARLAGLLALFGGMAACGAAATEPGSGISLGTPHTFATHAQLVAQGFTSGPSDGQFGAIRAKDGTYVFFGAAGGNVNCTSSPPGEATFAFTGTLDEVGSGGGCHRLFGPGDAPDGWVFDQNYAGGGQVTPFHVGSSSGLLMPFHGETWWTNPASADQLCEGVNCFYGSLGLAVSTDDGATFHVVGQIVQPAEPLSYFMNGGTNMAVGYGSLVVADASGKPVSNPPSDPASAYFYVFYADLLAGAPGTCGAAPCLAVARATYASVVEAALSGDPGQVASVFHKFYAGGWSEAATGGAPDESGTAGRFTPLWTNEAALAPSVIYDEAKGIYLAAYTAGSAVHLRTSSDLLHWSEVARTYSEPGRTLHYPTLLGETGDPTVAGAAPRLYFGSFSTFPDYTTAVFENVTLGL